MLDNLAHISQEALTKDKWGGQHKIIDKWLEDREHLLIDYCKLSGLPPFKKSQTLPSIDEIKAFSGLLIDYVSAGHFEIYEEIAATFENHGEDPLTPYWRWLIIQTTDKLVGFNDKYEVISADEFHDKLDEDLSVVGEALATRIELEDKLIHSLCNE
jgi:regulator of sigma D